MGWVVCLSILFLFQKYWYLCVEEDEKSPTIPPVLGKSCTHVRLSINMGKEQEKQPA
jgi:hypothetical protein